MIEATTKTIFNLFSSFADYLKWEWHEGLSTKFFKCMCCDISNFFDSLPFFLINLWFIILIISMFWFPIDIFLKWPNLMFSDLLFFGLIVTIPISIFFAFLILPYQFYLLCLSYQKSIAIPDYLSNGTHTGIIFCHYDSISSEAFTGDCIALLVKGLLRIKEPYKVYHCQSKNDFMAL